MAEVRATAHAAANHAAPNNHAGLICAIADLLRGDYRQPEYEICDRMNARCQAWLTERKGRRLFNRPRPDPLGLARMPGACPR